PPAGLQAGGALDHLFPVFTDAAPVKKRLNQPTLTQVEGALARQQPLAENPLRLLERLALHERALLCNEHLLDQVWMVEEKFVSRPPAKAGHVAVSSGHPCKRANRISIERDDGGPRDTTARAGARSGHVHREQATPTERGSVLSRGDDSARGCPTA